MSPDLWAAQPFGVALDWRVLLQLALVASAAFWLIRLARGTRVAQAVAGLAILSGIYAGAWLLGLGLITYLLGFVFQYGAIALLVVFAPELRNALAHLGQARFARLFHHLEQREVAEEIVEAVERLSRSGIGAIIAIERKASMEVYLESGAQLEAKVSAELLATIFTPYSPLHDGAVVVRGDMIVAAGVILPLSQQSLADRALGTRHRAALGLSDESDALVLVVSEERSTVSIADRGRLWRDLNPSEVRAVLAGSVPDRLLDQRAGAPG